MNKIFPIIPASNASLWTIAVIFIIILGLNILFGYIAYSTRHVQFILSEQGLEIKGDLYGTKLSKNVLKNDQVKLINLEIDKTYQPKWRTNGIGLPGYLSGWFRLKNKEKALLFVTDTKKVVYLPTTKGYSLMMTMQKPEDFIDSLETINY
jgi:hypothetical protein